MSRFVRTRLANDIPKQIVSLSADVYLLNAFTYAKTMFQTGGIDNGYLRFLCSPVKKGQG